MYRIASMKFEDFLRVVLSYNPSSASNSSCTRRARRALGAVATGPTVLEYFGQGIARLCHGFLHGNFKSLVSSRGEEGTRPVALGWAMGWLGGRRRAMARLRACAAGAATATIVWFARVRRARAGLGRSRPRGPASREGDVRPASNRFVKLGPATTGHGMVCARVKSQPATAGRGPRR